jgi:hypothetical protein
MLRWLIPAGSIILILLIIYGLYRACVRFKNRSALQSKVVSYFLSAEETEALYTGFSYVAFLEFFDKNGKELTLPKVYVDEGKKINGICYRFYEVGIGYPQLGKALRQTDSLPEPEILSTNVIDSRVIGGAKAQYHCDVLDASPDERAKKLKTQMIADKQWAAHVSHAQKILLLLKAQLKEPILQTRALPGVSEIGFGAGYLGNLKLTFATVGTFTASKRFLFLFELDKGFYIRKDITEATYGSQLSGLRVDSPIFGLSPAKASFVFEEPDLIAINRYIDLLVASKNFVYKHETDQKTIDAFMGEDVEQLLKAIHGKAIENSKRLTQLFLRKYGLEKDLQVELTFKLRKSEPVDL